MAPRTLRDIEKIWANVEGVKKLTDRAISIGPFGVGLDALITWVPVISPVYSAGVGGWLMVQAVRAKATPGTMAKMAAYLLFDTATDAVPFAGSVVDMLFPGHFLAAKALQKDIERTHWVDADAPGDEDEHRARARAAGRRRVVFLGR